GSGRSAMDDTGKRNELYLKAKALLSQVYTLPEGKRDDYVERETAGNAALREEVRWLLEALNGPETGNFLERPASEAMQLETGEPKVPAPRNYQLIRPLGEGGMGVVYLAERVEGEVKQVVALKLLNMMAMLNPMVVSRFLSERQLLARLNHPNIARLIDAGALADGRPFLAMEYIEGSPLDVYCEGRHLALGERLKLFLKVCAAVHYAHQNLIIHRDLKPGNVLVTAQGEPKLVDFGIARIDTGIETSSTMTLAGERMMTLAYASPEQLSGKPLSTATDVYSLGVMLYELLAGRRPWGEREDPLEMARAIGEANPAPPSTVKRRVQGRQRWVRALPRDLDAIVLKALRVQPQERYASVQALAEDIERFQATRPVRARRGHALYRLRMYTQRHWAALAVVSGVIALTAGYA